MKDINICELINVIREEYTALSDMLLVLEKQHSNLSKKNTMELEKCVDELNKCSKKVAQCEMNRRKLVDGESITDIINRSNDSELDKNYRDIKKLLYHIQVQRESNELLIKQGLVFSGKMLSILNPDRSIKTYGYSGRINK